MDVVGWSDLVDVGDCATGSFCSSCTIPPRVVVWWVDFGVMEWGVMRAAIPLGCCVVGVVES